MADMKEKAATHLILTVDVLEYLGFLINYEKSIVEPTQQIDFIGFLVNYCRHAYLVTDVKCDFLLSGIFLCHLIIMGVIINFREHVQQFSRV